jgi:hypothetical protein
MQFEGALIKQQGVTFAVVSVKKNVVDNPSEAERAIRAFSPAFPGVPVVVAGLDSWGGVKYYGRRDLVNFLANVPVHCIPWKRYNWN